ncbi:MAG: hypothetical protein WCA07_17530 [Gloeobacterales cyanobacterium]
MAVKKISDMLQEETQAKTQPELIPELDNSKTLKVLNPNTPKLSNSDIPLLPKYLTLENKAVRLRSDQIDALAALSKSLNRSRKSQGERITENTLIRVAIDLLLTHGNVHGTTEEEIKANLLNKN